MVVTTGVPARLRWTQLALGLMLMVAISSPQYVWTLFVAPYRERLGASLAEVQVVFSLLLGLQCFLAPLNGWLLDRFGARRLLMIGAALTGASWILASTAESLVALYLLYGVLGGIGTGIVYIGVVGLMVRWFPDRRGLVAGIVAAGYGMGASLTTFPVAHGLAAVGLGQTLMLGGIVFGSVGLACAVFMRAPRLDQIPAVAVPKLAQGQDLPSARVLRQPVFWLMYFMFAAMATSGLMVISQMGAFAKDFGITGATVFGMAALPLALTLDRVTNGLTRPFFGWISDHAGRENTMFIAFALEGVAMTIWFVCRHDPVLFVLLSGVVFFGWGEIFSLFPSTLTDTFGPANASTNYGLLYTAGGVAATLGGPLAALLYQQTGTWTLVFSVAIGANFTTAILALFLLKPMRARYIRGSSATHESGNPLSRVEPTARGAAETVSPSATHTRSAPA